MRGGGSEKEIERKRDINRERERERCPQLLFLFFKGMTGTLAPFSFLVFYILISIWGQWA